MAGGGQLALRGQMSQKRLDFCTTPVGGMLELMKANERARHVHVGPLGLQAVVDQPATLANLIEQSHRLQRWKSHYRPGT